MSEFFHVIRLSLENSIKELNLAFKPPEKYHSKLSKIQCMTATVAFGALSVSACAFAIIFSGYLEHKIMEFLTHHKFTTMRAGLIMCAAPYLFTVAKISLVVAAISAVSWAATTVLRLAYDIHQNYAKPCSN